jgi:cytochrome c oxidase subunit 1
MATAAFALATMTIAVPTGVKIFNWIGTLWGGRIQLRVPMMYALGFIWMFMLGGFTGIMHSAAPADAQQQDSYFIIAHFHYVLIGGSILALLGGLYYWQPKMTGRIAGEGFGKLYFWMIMIGFNVTFFPMHFLGLNGMPRRIYTYDSEMGWDRWNFVCTIGALILGLGIFLAVMQLLYTIYRGKKCGNDPWHGRTLEWSLPSPPPEYNFAAIPVVRARDVFWHDKHTNTPPPEHPSAAHDREHGVHLPDQSWYPFIASSGIFVLGFGLLGRGAGLEYFQSILPGWLGWLATFIATPVTIMGVHPFTYAGLTGAIILITACYLWAMEGPAGYHVHPEAEEGHGEVPPPLRPAPAHH